MKRGKLTNRELDELGIKLVRQCRTTDAEIEKIVSDPDTFDGVLARIAAAPQPRAEVRTSRSLRPAAAALMALLLLSVPFLAYLKYSGVTEQAIRNDRKLPPVYTVDPDPKPFVPVVRTEEPGDEKPRPVRAVVTRTVETIPASKPRKPRFEPLAEADNEFHPIGSAEKAEDAAIDGRVVRVEMPRATLFAMGVDVPLENGSRPIKADLLVGSDGSPRAIRFVD